MHLLALFARKFIIFSKMKNSLELEIVTKLKKANQFFSRNHYQQALNLYVDALGIYHDNIIYNPSISPHFQSTIYSLIGVTQLQIGDLSQAEEALTYSLKISPYLSTSLIRRAKVFLKMDRISQAIEDLENAYIGEPDNKNISDLITEAQVKVDKIENCEEKRRLRELLTTIYTVSEQSKESMSEEEMLSFSNLKRIDRCSIRNPKKKSSIFSHFKESDESEGKTFDQEDQMNNLPVQIISKSKSSFYSSQKKGHEKIKSSFVQQKAQKNSIDSEIQTPKSNGSRSSVRFSKNRDSRQKDFDGIESKKTSSIRKSCLRSSKIVKPQQLQTSKQRISTLSNIKNIDGSLILHSKKEQLGSQVYTEILDQNNIKKSNLNIKSLIKKADSAESQQVCESSSDDEGNEHNIYGSNFNNSNVLMCIQNLSNWSIKNSDNGSISNGGKKKGSILRKQSLIESSKGIRKSEKKKSVCFLGADENSRIHMSIQRI